MSSTSDGLVPRAIQAYRQGRYKEAKALYEAAARQYGAELFKVNIGLCNRALGNGESGGKRGSSDTVVAGTRAHDSSGIHLGREQGLGSCDQAPQSANGDNDTEYWRQQAYQLLEELEHLRGRGNPNGSEGPTRSGNDNLTYGVSAGMALQECSVGQRP